MQSTIVKRAETELRTAVQATGWQLFQQPVSRVNSQRIETSDYPATSRCAPEDEKHVNRDVECDDDHRHWSPTSQSYAPADILFQHLRAGWLLGDKALVQVGQCFSRRCVEVYYFRLTSGSERIVMPIIANPVILRLTLERELAVIRVYPDYEFSDLLFWEE